jgi:hypothetical protein
MSIGYADDTGGLADFDEDAALQNLSQVGQGLPRPDTSVDTVSGGAVSPTPPPAGPELMAPDFGTDVPGADAAPPAPVPQPATPQAAAADIGEGQLKPPPQLTGDPQKDGAALVEYQRYLADRHAETSNKQAQIKQQEALVGQMRGKKELEAAQHVAEQKQAEIARYEKERAERQTTIEEAIKERIAARKDLEHGPDKLHGGQIIAAIFGAVGASLQNMAAVQAGHVGNFENQALNVIQAKFKQQYERRLERIKTAGDELLMARYGAKDAAEAHRAALNDLDAKTAAEYKLAEKAAADRLAQLGVPKAAIEQNEVILKLRQEEAKTEQEIHLREEAQASQRAQAGATLKLAEANLGERKSEFRTTSAERSREFKLRQEDAAAARAERARLAREKADEKKEKSDEDKAVRVHGSVVGYAPSPRVVKPIEDRAVQYDDAIKSAEDLLAYAKEHSILGRIPAGDRYDRAVLAVAATTQANASDATTSHEAGTLKSYGLTSPDAIERTLEHLRKRQAEFMSQLRPVGVDEGRLSLPPPESVPTRGGAPQRAPKLTGADAERMRAARAAGDHSFDAILDQYGF